MVNLLKQLEVLDIELASYSLLFFLACVAVLSFVIGFFYARRPLFQLKKKVTGLAKKIRFSAGENVVEERHSDVWSFLEGYLKQVEDQSKSQEDQIASLKRTMDALTETITESVMIFTTQKRLLFHNTQTEKLFHLQNVSQKPHLNDITRSLDVTSLFKECLKTEKILMKECVFYKKNRYFQSCFRVTAVPLKSVDGKLERIVLFFYDQTDVKRSQQAHIDFVSNVSHELKTPLTSIQGFVEMLMHDLANKRFDQFENFLSVSLRNCKRMNTLIDDLLELSVLSSASSLKREKISTKEITERVIREIKSKNRQLHFSFSATHVVAHPRWLEIVLYNLIDNACRHTSESCHIFIQWEKMNDRVVLKVIDDGEGISERYAQRVFERFFRIDPARSRKGGGTGVGLSLVKQSMEKQGGSVRVVPAKKGGAEFICEFPNS